MNRKFYSIMAACFVFALLINCPRSASAQTCAAAWSSTAIYTQGMTASENGNNYTAAYWTQGNDPSVAGNSGAAGSGDPWSLPTACGSVSTPTGPSGYTYCAPENSTCSFSGTASVAFGANGLFYYQTLTNGASCTDAVFGDPDVGVVKACFYQPVTTPAGPAGYTYCAPENSTCSFSGTASVAFGANGLFNYQTFTNSASCTDAVFGDPDYGVVKACFYKSTSSTTGSYFVGGWYEEWSTYYANYNVSDLQNSGMVPSLTHVIYAFAKPTATGCQLADTYADYQKAVPLLAGAPALPSGLAGNFGGLWQLKQLYPNLKILLSIGGWNPPTYNQAFAAASATQASRQAFVSSCISTFIQGNIASGVTVPNLFDGFDIDWEFPNASESAGFTALITEFRNELTTLSASTGKTYQVAADLAAGASTPGAAADSGNDGGYDTIDIPGLSAQLDYMNVDGYNYSGDWTLTTDEASPLYDDSLDSANPLYPNNSIDYTVKYYLAHGAPAAKYTLGMPGYGVGWSGGLTSTNGGMYQTATELAPIPNANGVGSCSAGATGCDPLETNGMAAYATIENAINAGGYTVIFDSTRVDMNAFNPTTNTVWNYDDPTSIAAKVAYIKANGLGGSYIWAVSTDDANGTLTKALGNGLN
jgi:chitinase